MGSADPNLNPFLNARIPVLRGLLGHSIPVLDQAFPGVGRPDSPGEAAFIPLEPLMGVPGLPQSGTGQVGLLTGRNAAKLYGRHFGPWVPVPLRTIMMEENILSRALRGGLSCAFANAYPSSFLHLAWTKRPAGPPLAARGAGLLSRTESDLARGEAVSSEILNTAWRQRLRMPQIPEITAQEAGGNLARIVERTDLTLFAHYTTDTAGHQGTMKAAVEALERVDAFLEGLLTALPRDTLLVMASDHGNIEDVSQGHTRNPTFNLLMGEGAQALGSGLIGITDLADAVLQHLLKKA